MNTDPFVANYSNCVNNPTDQVVTLACIPDLIENIIIFGLDLAGTACLIVIILGGIKFIMARGDPKELLTARHSIYYAIIGLVIVLLAFTVIDIIGITTGARCISILNQDFGNCK